MSNTLISEWTESCDKVVKTKCNKKVLVRVREQVRESGIKRDQRAIQNHSYFHQEEALGINLSTIVYKDNTC